VVFALVDEDVPVVEAVRVVADAVALAVAHVPLADEAGAIAGVAQLGHEGRLGGVEKGVEGRDAVLVAVGAGKQRGSARGAQRVRREEVVEPDAGAGDGVEMWRGVDHRAVGADRVGGVVVAEEEEDVRAPCVRGRVAHRRRLRSST
jgi:hypothetical protein